MPTFPRPIHPQKNYNKDSKIKFLTCLLSKALTVSWRPRESPSWISAALRTALRAVSRSMRPTKSSEAPAVAAAAKWKRIIDYESKNPPALLKMSIFTEEFQVLTIQWIEMGTTSETLGGYFSSEFL